MLLLYIIDYAFGLIISLLSYLMVTLAITILWRAYKIYIGRLCFKLAVRSDHAILITGATSGIGLALAKHFYRLGYSVFAGYYNSNEIGYGQLKALSKQSLSGGQKLLLVELDVRSEDSTRSCYQEVEAKLKELNLNLFALVNNAGLGSLQPFPWLQRTTIRDLVETNLTGTLLMTREFLPLLVDLSRKTGYPGKPRIINVSSGLGFVPGANYTTYGLTKSAQLYLTRSLNLGLERDFNVKSVAVVPHNFIKNTNICSLNASRNDSAWTHLKPLERELYRDKIAQHSELSRSLDKAIGEHAKLAHDRAIIKHSQSPKESTSWSANLARVRHILQRFINTLKGENSAITLEESGILECFEDAIRLEDPPEVIFAGDSMFSLLVGSIFLLLPQSCAPLLGSSVSPSLYR